MYILGADPGLSGAIAVLDTQTGILQVADMPVTKDPKGRAVIDPYGLYDMLELPPGTRCMAVIELVHAMPKQGVTSSFRFGEAYGALKMAVGAHKIPVHHITPAVWKKHLGLTSDKDSSRGLASARFPANAKDFSRVMDHGRAEAALIAVYGYEKLLPKI